MKCNNTSLDLSISLSLLSLRKVLVIPVLLIFMTVTPHAVAMAQTEIQDWHDLDEVRDDLNGEYVLVNDLDSETAGYTDVVDDSSEGFDPIADFGGEFDGENNIIEDLHIDRPDEVRVGLFASTEQDAQIRDLELKNVDVEGEERVGGLVGENRGDVSESYSTGVVEGDARVGGLVGENRGDMSESYSTGVVEGDGRVLEGDGRVGGLVGENRGEVSESYATGNVEGELVGGLVGLNNGEVSESYATGNVEGESESGGGLVGLNIADVTESYATGSVSGEEYVGGLVGENRGDLSESYAMGNVEGESESGGLVGYNRGDVSESYATGNVEGDEYVGGLVGWSNDDVSESYATGNVEGKERVGGLVGESYGDVSDSYWDDEAATITEDGEEQDGQSDGGEPLTTAEMTGDDAEDNMFEDFGDTWDTVEGDPTDGFSVFYPVLQENTQDAPAAQTLYADGDGDIDPYEIEDWYQLDNVRENPESDFVLTEDLDSEPVGYADVVDDPSEGFDPIADFDGEFDGENNTIEDLHIDRPEEDQVGLFATTEENAEIQGVYLENVDVTGGGEGSESGVGSLVGLNDGEVSESYATGDVDGDEAVGGLVGWNDAGTITEAFADGNVNGDLYVGGLAGANVNGSISESYATGDVDGGDGVGGLVGNNIDREVIESYATGDVSGDERVGGLVGANTADVIDSYWDDEAATVTVDDNEQDDQGVGDGDDSGVTGFTTDEMTSLNATEYMVGFEFPDGDGTWHANADYPALSWEETDEFYGVNVTDTNSPVQEGNTLEVTVDVTNLGADGDVQQIELVDTDFEDELRASEGVILDSGENQELTLEWQTEISNAGTGDVTVASENDSDIEEVTVEAGVEAVTASIDGEADPTVDVGKAVEVIISVTDSEDRPIEDEEVSIENIDKGGDEITIDGLSEGDTRTSDSDGEAGFGGITFSGAIGGTAMVNFSAEDGTEEELTVTVGGFAGGDGSEETPYEITDWYHLDNVREHLDANFVLSADLDEQTEGYGGDGEDGVVLDADGELRDGGNPEGDNADGFEPIGNDDDEFTGTFDGDDRTITGLQIDGDYVDDHGVGLFGNTEGSYIEHLSLEDVEIKSIRSDPDHYWRGEFAGGLAGRHDGTVEGVSVTGTVSGYEYVGGVVGVNGGELANDEPQGAIYNSSADVTVIADTKADVEDHGFRIGGLAGRSGEGSEVHNSSATGDVIGDEMKEGIVWAGGLIGEDFGNLTESYAIGNVTGGRSRVGGLVGESDGEMVLDSYATGDVTGEEQVGGLIGSNEAELVKNSYATGDVTGEDRVGGLNGRDNGDIVENSSATGTVSGESRVGGLLGQGRADVVSNSFSTGDVTGDEEVGGLVGQNDADVVKNSYATGDITGEDNVGGLIGDHRFGEDIEMSYATGDVTGESTVGGLIGILGSSDFSSSYLETSYATGNVTGDERVGGLVGESEENSDVADSYWDRGTTNQADAIGKDDGTTSGLVGFGDTDDTEPADEMQRFAPLVNMSTFDYDDTWTLSIGYPRLNWEEEDEITLDKVVADDQSAEAGEETSVTVTAKVDGSGAGEAVTVEVVDDGGLDELTEGDTKVTDSDSEVVFSFTEETADEYTPEFAWEDDHDANDASGVTINSAGPDELTIAPEKGTTTVSDDFEDDNHITFTVTIVDEWDNHVPEIDVELSDDGESIEIKDDLTTATGEDGEAEFTIQSTRQQEVVEFTFTEQESGNELEVSAEATFEFGEPDELVFVDQPEDHIYGESTTTEDGDPVTVEVLDTFGNIVEDAGDEVSLTVGTGNGSLSETVTADADEGVASFDDITVTAATEHTLKAEADHIDESESDTFTITPAALTITASDSSGTYGEEIDFNGDEFSASGLVLDDEIDEVNLTSEGAPESAEVGSYDIEISDATGADFDAENYDITYEDGELEVTPAELTVTAEEQEKNFGEELMFTGDEFEADGLQADDQIDETELTSEGTPESAEVGSYAIEISDATGADFDADNYDITYEDGELEVNPADLTITANDRDKTYGEELTFSGDEFEAEGLQADDVIDQVELISDGAPESAEVGIYAIEISEATGAGFDAGNYNITYEDGELEVNPADLTLTANDQDKTYGEELTFSGDEFEAEGLQADDEIDQVELTSDGAPESVEVGTYAIEISEATGPDFYVDNYDITYEDGELTIEEAVLTIAGRDDVEQTYEGTEWQVTAYDVIFDGFADGQDESDLTGELAYSLEEAGEAVNAGEYTFTPEGLSSDNYDIVYESGELEIIPADLMITADDQKKTYVQAIDFDGDEFEADGLQADDEIDQVDLTSDGAPETAEVGTYAIKISDATGADFDADNYDITYQDGELTVEEAVLTITGRDDIEHTYDGTEWAITTDDVSFDGFEEGEDPSDLTGELDYSLEEADEAVGAGEYTFTPEGLSSDNYDIEYESGELEITSAQLTVTADDQDKTYGEELTFAGDEFEAEGLQAGDEIDQVNLTSDGAEETAEVGTYDVQISDATEADFDADNYDITYEAGLIEVKPAELIVTVEDQETTFDGNPWESDKSHLSISGLVLDESPEEAIDEVEFDGDAEGAEEPGDYTINPVSLDAANYEVTEFNEGQLTIHPQAEIEQIELVHDTPSNRDEVAFEISFSTEVTFADEQALMVDTTGDIDGVGITEVSPGLEEELTDSYTITIETGENDGTIALEVEKSAFADERGNPLDEAQTSETYQIDKTEPVADITTDHNSPTNVSPLEFEIFFEDAMEGIEDFVMDDLSLSGVDEEADETSLSGSESEFNLTVVPASDETEVEVLLEEGAVSDAAGNALSETAQSTLEYDATPPEITSIKGFDADSREELEDPFNQQEFDVDITFDEKVQDVDTGRIEVEGAELVETEIDEDVLSLSMRIPEEEHQSRLEIVIEPQDGMAEDQAGNSYEADDDQAVFTYDGPPEVVDLLSPEDDALDKDLRPEFSWDSVNRATGYQLQIATDESFADDDLIKDADDITETSFRPDDELEYEQDYYWQVRAVNDDLTGEWSDPRSFVTVPKPPESVELIAPEHKAEDVELRPELDWEQLQRVEEYQLQVTEGGDFEDDLLIDTTSAELTKFEIQNELDEDQLYSWRARGMNAGGKGEWSEHYVFTTRPAPPEPVTLSSPADSTGSVAIAPELSWEEADRAYQYRLEVSENSDFEDTVVEEKDIDGLAYQSVEDLDSYEIYFWRVRAENSGGSGDWSESKVFITEAEKPDARFPIAGAEDISTAPELNWSSVYSETAFEIRLGDNEDMEGVVRELMSDEDRKGLNGLNTGTEYYWQVRLNDELTSSAWSSPQSFTTRPEREEETEVDISIHFDQHNEDEIASEDFRLLGLPGDSEIALDDIIEGDYEDDWRAFEDTGEPDDYLSEFDPSENRLSFGSGRGYWVFNRDGVDVDKVIEKAGLDEQDSYEISLNDGWNIIANPFVGQVKWGDIEQFNEIEGTLYAYEEMYEPAEELSPLEGYYFYNDPELQLDTLRIPYGELDSRFDLNEEEQQKTTYSKKQTSEEAGRIKVEVDFMDGDGNRQDLISNVELTYDDEGRGPEHPPLKMARYGMALKESGEDAQLLRRKSTEYQADATEYGLQFKAPVGSEVSWNVSAYDMNDGARILLVNPVTQNSHLLGDEEQAEDKVTEPEVTYDMYVGDESTLQEIEDNLLPDEVTLKQNYPNPFNPITTIRYALPEDSQVQLEVYNVLGQRVATLVDGEQQTGWHTAQFDGASLASGTYIYRLIAGDQMETGKMMLVK